MDYAEKHVMESGLRGSWRSYRRKLDDKAEVVYVVIDSDSGRFVAKWELMIQVDTEDRFELSHLTAFATPSQAIQYLLEHAEEPVGYRGNFPY